MTITIDNFDSCIEPVCDNNGDIVFTKDAIDYFVKKYNKENDFLLQMNLKQMAMLKAF